VNYNEILRRFYTLYNQPYISTYNLDNPLRLQRLFDYPDKAYPTIHVGGTNGKGSVCWKLARLCSNHYPKVGLFSSPHISSFRERLMINHKPISIERVELLFTKIFHKLDSIADLHCSFFELLSIAALLYFKEEQVDMAVIEVGLGGRLDATNVIKPGLSVITSVGYDHMDVLGNDLESIAKEKAGIIKPGVPLVLGPSLPQKIIQEIACNTQAPFIQVESVGDSEMQNQAIAKAGAQILGLSNLEGIFSLPPCRFEYVPKSQVPAEVPAVILDVAHNPASIQSLLARIQGPLRIAFTLGKQKDILSLVALLKPFAPNIHLLDYDHDRLLCREELEKAFYGIPCFAPMAIDTALRQALDLAEKNHETLVIFGSFFIHAKVRQFFNYSEEVDDVPVQDAPLLPARHSI
jgi:dihydrofolate synthase/folylpolyglutamate synthase